MKQAIVSGGVIVELPSVRVHRDLVTMVPDEAEIGWVQSEDSFEPPPPPAPPTPAALLAYAGKLRWEREVGGMVWNGVPIATDDSSKIKVAGARIKAEADPAFETTWYGTDGDGVVVDAPLIIALSNAVLEHIDQSFTTFGLVKGAIAAGTITSFAAIDAAFA